MHRAIILKKKIIIINLIKDMHFKIKKQIAHLLFLKKRR